MARPHRKNQKRKIAQARNDIDRALGKIVILHDEFNPVHPEYAQLLEATAKSLILSKQFLEDFWRLAWGSLPGNWDTFVGDGRERGGDAQHANREEV